MTWGRRLLNVFRQERLSAELDRELEFHLAERVDELRAAGMSQEAALREAKRRLGNYGLQKERTRDVDVLGWLDTLVADIRYALRAMRANPGFSFVAIVSLALAIGANTAIFSLMDAVVLRKLPVREPDQLVQVMQADGATELTNPLWEALYAGHNGAFDGIAAFAGAAFNLADGGEIRPVYGNWVSGEFFSMLGVQAALGRVLHRGDDHRGCPAVAVLGNGFWNSEYGGSRDVVGRSVSLNGKSFQIVGVVDASFLGLEVGRSVQVYAPLCAEAIVNGPGSILDRRYVWFVQIVGRPQTGLSLDALNSRLAAIAPAAYAVTVPPEFSAEDQAGYLRGSFTATGVATGVSSLRETYSRPLVVLMGLVAVVLLIASANVANLLLARATARQREIAVRMSIGASRGRVVRQLLTESAVLALLSSMFGVAVAWFGSRGLVSMLSTSGSIVSLDLPLDLRVLGFTLAMASAAALLFGLAPAWRAGRSDPQAVLRASGRGMVAHSRFNVGKALVVGQVALSLGLVVAAGLLLGTFRKLSTLDPGFAREGVLMASVTTGKDDETVERQRSVYDAMLEQLRAAPGVERASGSQLTPVGRGGWNSSFLIDGYQPPTRRDGLAFLNEVTDGYFETLGTRFVTGRDFDTRDRPGAPRVAIVNQAFAAHFFGSTNVVGRRFRMRSETAPEYEIIGVVRDAKYYSLREAPQRIVYLPWTQAEERAGSFTFEVRGTASPAAMMHLVRSIAAGIDPALSLRFTSLDRQVSESITRERVLALLSAFFGTLALLLAAIGLYGVMAYNVARRRAEIGIRVALGCARIRILNMILGEAALLLGLGLVLGAAVAVAAIRLVSSFLFGVTPTDTATLLLCAGTLTAAGFAAAALPAWRASRVEPMTALRQE